MWRNGGVLIATSVVWITLGCGGGVPALPDVWETDVQDAAQEPEDTEKEVWHPWCVECSEEAACVGGVCAPVEDGKYCLPMCQTTMDCPPGYKCVRLAQFKGVKLCYPWGGSCGCSEQNSGASKPCVKKNDYGECHGTATCDPEKGWMCDAREPAEERCNHVDDDCDGETDEDFLMDGMYVTDENCGECGVSCTAAIEHGIGMCEVVDDAPACVPKSCEPGYVAMNGQCVPGYQNLCKPCTSQTDCEGLVCVLLEGEGAACTMPCPSSGCPKGFLCQGLAVGDFCLPPAGSCQCTPENVGITRPCAISNGFGTCEGTETCTESGFSGCTARVPQPEDCNGTDDDCDGLTDEGLGGEQCERSVPGIGTCVGTRHCLGKEGYACDAPEPEPETCDYKDNDCDGLTDEDFRDATSGLYVADKHCGGCGNDCSVLQAPGGTYKCQVHNGVASCGLVCNKGFVDLNQDPSDGCECQIVSTEDPPNGIDENCDGVDGEWEKAVFVAAHGSDTNPGTPQKPVRTVPHGVQVAQVEGLPYVYVAAGTYSGRVVLAGGQELYGGFSPDFSVYDPDQFESILSTADCSEPGTVAFLGVRDGQKAGLHGFVVQGPDCLLQGQSSCAVYLEDSDAGVSITGNKILGGKGADGVPGAPGLDGKDGAPGQDGLPAVELAMGQCMPGMTNPGGDPGKSQCGTVDTSGGHGGSGVCPDFDETGPVDECPYQAFQSPTVQEPGEPGKPSVMGGKGGAAGRDSLITHLFMDPDTFVCSSPSWACKVCVQPDDTVPPGQGQDGKPGKPGAPGPGCSNPIGHIDGSVWVGGAGQPGNAGGPGGGGGGGGAAGGVETSPICAADPLGPGYSDVGASGGGGGAGGCGGSGGQGGGGGGASFAVFLVWTSPPGSVPTIKDNVVVTGTGGDGGAGGPGGYGGQGGAGGKGGAGGQTPKTWCTRNAGPGGDGGNGGPGGGGGGGCGGPSFGIFASGVSGQLLQAYKSPNNKFELQGAGGKGGPGGPSQGLPGENGADGPHEATNF